MMRLTQPRRVRAESVVPMINVAFLLLIFFLMAAVIAPPEPVDVSLPEAEAMTSDAQHTTISVTADGVLARETRRGDAVFDGLQGESVRLRVDAAVPGADLARLLSRLSAAGAARVELVTLTP